MRIFVILPRVPYPLEKGDKLRAFHQIKELSKNNEIILCALNHNRKLDKQKAFSKLQPYCRSVNFIDLTAAAVPYNIIRAFFKGLPLQVGYFYNARAYRKIGKLFNEYKPDRVYCQLVRTAEYGINLNVSKTIDYQDVFSYGAKRRMEQSSWWLKPILKSEYKRLIKYEDKVFETFDEKTIISVPDRDLIHHRQRDRIHIIPNGVDHNFFKPVKKHRNYDVVFTGNMNYPPNVDAAGFLVKEIMPLVWNKLPDTKVVLAGAAPHNKVKMLENEKVTVTGWMDDIRDAYAASKVFIAPMRIGTGLQNKLLEAMSMKIPCITTPLANNALQAENGKNILIGKNHTELGQCIVDLLTDDRLSTQIAESGFDFVHRQYSWSEASLKLEKVIRG
jgi:sugar transferase (PEP-CTERM/EpsH1 system associated)